MFLCVSPLSPETFLHIPRPGPVGSSQRDGGRRQQEGTALSLDENVGGLQPMKQRAKNNEVFYERGPCCYPSIMTETGV